MKRVSLSAQNAVKRYGGVVALADGNLSVSSGEVVALVGANGSGKSTLTKIITGVVASDKGQLLLNDNHVTFPSPMAARREGITAVYQDLSLVPRMTVAENIWLAHEPLTPDGRINRKALEARTQELLNLFKGTYRRQLAPDIPIVDLPPDEKQIVEILKALSLEPSLMILDEATASLDSRQVERLFELIGAWRQQGMALVFVSHRMGEIFRIADRVTVLRNGRSVGDAPIGDITESDLVGLMVGEEIEEETADLSRRIKRKLEGDDAHTISLSVDNLYTERLRGINFEVHKGELLGLGGLQGQGQRELLLTLYGHIPYTGTVEYFGEPVSFRHPRQAMKNGFALVPGERAREGLLMIRSILENLLLPSWRRYGTPLRMKSARLDGEQISDRLNMVRETLEAPVNSLSGGNAQKVVIGKWLLRDPRVLLLDDPTKGVDVGTKTELYSLLTQLCEQGTTVIFNSSDDDELLMLCDRVIVLQDGQIQAELIGDGLNRKNLVAAGMGINNEGSSHES